MKINEIMTLASRDEPIINFEWKFENTSKEPAFEDLEFAVSVLSSDEQFLGLFSNDRLIAYLNIVIGTCDKWQVAYSLTDRKFRGQGCFRYLLQKAVDLHGEILSDSRQTPEAQSAWKRLMEIPGYLEFFVFDEKTQTISKDFDKAWNGKDNPVLLVKDHREHYSPELLESVAKAEVRKKKIGRDYTSLFYGPKSSNDEYINP